jgi:hypothetical protein
VLNLWRSSDSVLRRTRRTFTYRSNRAFVESPNGSPRLFYLLPYSPDRNPDEDELVWKDLEADIVGRMAITSKDAFKAKDRSSMRQLQNNPEKISSLYRKPLSDTPLECLVIYELINSHGAAARARYGRGVEIPTPLP